MRTEYISKETGIDALSKRVWSSDNDRFRAIDAITEVPAEDVVKVVRCRKCRYHKDKTPEDVDFELFRNMVWCSYMRTVMWQSDFCRWGERPDPASGRSDSCENMPRNPADKTCRRDGVWVDISDGDSWECGCCGHVEETDRTEWLPNFCPECGADMREWKKLAEEEADE